ncbi:MAG: hypothetical protein CVV64_17455 [Candidatus Wallbacteria bacterium HGW-Wallbacteria-1]|jgi:hypothetical protein|uniref:Response regulatory domain-containing protein n=1 Tax=Candidatus Wallbacteria bacterium HGW-Wallbacteria-1 TaxID=2013854 RepID=A0A2N1PK67_9BACT|nr:MAG: hypothetical protein CVV64_17455 [Candidatus Wallbacteria bacterium HGW-Wallbacteria-1]
MGNFINKFKVYLSNTADYLSSSRTRLSFHAALLYIFALAIIASTIVFDYFSDPEVPMDKHLHFLAGRILTAVIFLGAYLGIIARIFCSRQKSITQILLWIPSLIALAFIVAITVTIIFGATKELADTIGMGSAEWLDFDYTFQGALSMAFPISIIMILTPFFIPGDILMQIPRLAFSDIKSGFDEIDNYLIIKKKNRGTSGFYDVLLVEDDISCATVAMKFCDFFNLKCKHVSSISEADVFLKLNFNHIKLILLDNFIRVGNESGGPTTGSEWLDQIPQTWKNDERPFKVVMITGHPELTYNSGARADLILKKPWKPENLAAFLMNCGLIQQKSGKKT